VEPRSERQSPREFLLERLKGRSLAGGEELRVGELDGYALLTRNGSPLDGGSGPIRYGVVYRGNSAFLFAGASRSAAGGKPEADGLFLSVIGTLRELRPSEFPLAEPHRIKLVKATADTRLAEYADRLPEQRYQVEHLELMNGLYPRRPPPVGEFIKVVE
jgi:predicted Zn-dependent protease